MKKSRKIISLLVMLLIVINAPVIAFADTKPVLPDMEITINSKDEPYKDYTPQEMRDYIEKKVFKKYKGYNLKLTLVGKFKFSGYKMHYFSNTYIDATKATLTQVDGARGFFRNESQGNGGYDDLENVTIKGGTWICGYSGTGSESFTTMVFSHATNITVEDAKFVNNYNGHMIELAGCKNVVIRNCDFGGVYKGPGEQEAIQLETCRKGYVNDVVYDDTACNGVLVENCTFKFPKSVGCHRAVEGSFTRNVTVKDCTMNTKHEGINAFCVIGFTATGNTINGGTMGISFKTYAPTSQASFVSISSKKTPVNKNYKINISNNTIKNCSSYAIHLIGNSSRKIKNVIVTGNTVSGVKSYGVYAERVVDGDFSENTVENISTRYVHGIYANLCKNIAFTQETVTNITGTGARGIFINNTEGATVASNKINNTAKEGIAIENTYSLPTVSGNKVSAADGTGIYAYKATGITIENNVIKSSKCNAITLNSSKALSVVEGNHISKTNRYGIYLTNTATATVSGNVIRHTLKQSVYALNASSSKIVKNKLYDFGASGIYTNNGNKPITVKSNTVSCDNNGNRGIFMRKVKNAEVSKNKISGAKCTNPITITKKSTANIKSLKKVTLNNIYTTATVVKGKTVENQNISLYYGKKKIEFTVENNKWVSRDFKPKKVGKTFKIQTKDEAKNTFTITKEVMEKQIKPTV